ncbi:MAG TPA: rod shape-determining protein MreC [bacterium]|nr:rod shape-determining protein MreC [bacterium]
MFAEWLRRNQNVVVPLALFLSSLTLLSYESYSPKNQRTSLFAGVVIDVISLGQRSVTGVAYGIRDTFQHYFWLRGVEEENEELRRRVSELDSKNQRLQEQAYENERLRKLLNFEPMEGFKTVPAQVIGESALGLPKTITIEKGSLSGIRPRMAVISYNSALVGQILDQPGSGIGAISCQVLLITDQRSRVSVMVQRPASRAKGMLVGRPGETNTCDLLYTERHADIRAGDTLITSGYGGVFMKGLPVGVIKEIVNDPASYYPLVRVDPVADFSKLEEVLVIVPEGEGP